MTVGQVTINEVGIFECDSNPSLSPGLAAPVGSLALLDGGSGIWQKYGPANTDWESTKSKSGFITYTSFTGTPKKALVTFAIPFPDVNYGIVVSGIDRRTWSIEDQTSNGFVVNANANQAITDSVFWIATKNGE